MKTLTSTFFILLLAVSYIVHANEATIPIQTGHKLVTDQLVKKLTKDHIWFKKDNVTTIIVKTPVPTDVINFVEKEINKIVPKNRSMSVSHQFRKELYETLNKDNINFTLVTYANAEFMVWEHKDTKVINDTLSSISERYLNENHSEKTHNKAVKRDQ